MTAAPLVRVEGLTRRYGSRDRSADAAPPAVDRVSFTVAAGETLALVGESGSGKSTLGRMAIALEPIDEGEVWLDGQPLAGLSQRRLRGLRPTMQMIFQNPYSALNPRMRVGDFVAEPLRIHRRARNQSELKAAVADLFGQVGLDPSVMKRWPHEFSGGQRQRLNIARAIALNPRFIVADEPITALDVSIQAQIVNLMQDIQARTGVSYLFISHDLGMVRHLSHRVAVMRGGRIVEMANTADLFDDPRHPYTRALLSAAPIADPRIERTRQRLDFDPAVHPVPADAQLHEVAPAHWVLS